MAFQKDGLEQLSCMNKNEHGFFLFIAKSQKKKKKKNPSNIRGEKKQRKRKQWLHEDDLWN